MKDTTQPFSSGEENDPTYRRVAPSTKSYASTKSVKSRAKSTTHSTQFSGTVSCASTEVKENLTQVAPDGERCLITRAAGELQYSHLIARSTDIAIQEVLEAAWGMEVGEFDLNAVQNSNIFWLKSDLHLAFDASAIDFSNRRAGQHTPSHFGTVYSNKTWKYHFLPLDYNTPFLRYSDDFKSLKVHQSPYPKFRPMESHLNPFFTIYNVGEKVRYMKNPKHNGYFKLPEDPRYRPSLDKCETLYLLWVGPTLEALEADIEQSPSERSRYQAPSDSERQSQNEERTYRLEHRNGNKDAQNSQQSGSGSGAPQGRNCTGTTETTDQYLPTPEQSVHSTDCKIEAVSGTHKPARHWANLDDWVASVKSCASNLGPQSDWEGAEQAKQSLVEYRREAAREPSPGLVGEMDSSA